MLCRYERGGFCGGGNNRWVEDARDEEDWSKPLTPNERLEQWVIFDTDTNTIGRMQADMGSIMLWVKFCCETFGSDLHIDVITYKQAVQTMYSPLWHSCIPYWSELNGLAFAALLGAVMISNLSRDLFVWPLGYFHLPCQMHGWLDSCFYEQLYKCS